MGGCGISDRIMHSGCPYFQHLAQEKQQQEVLESEEETALFEFVHVWLEKLLDHLWGGGGRLRACPLLRTCAKPSSGCVNAKRALD